MRIVLIEGDKQTPLKTENQSLQIFHPLAFFRVELEKGEICSVKDAQGNSVLREQSNYIKIATNKPEQVIQFRTQAVVVSIKVELIGLKVFSPESEQNLVHFMTSVLSFFEKGKNIDIQNLMELVESGDISLLSFVKPLTGYDNKELVTKLKDVLSQKVMSICSTPKKGTKIDELVQDVSLVKRINSNSLNHLASHTEHWKVKTLSGLIPKRLKSEVIEEEVNIYENLFFKMAVDEISSFVNGQIDRLTRAGEQTHSSIEWEKYGTQLNDYRRSEILLKLTGGQDSENRKTDEKIFADAKTEWLRISQILISIKASNFYKKIDVAKAKALSKTRIYQTNILKNEQRYKALYEIWNLIRIERQKQKEEKQGASDDLVKCVDKCYRTYTVIAFLYALRLVGVVFSESCTMSISQENELLIDVNATDEMFNYSFISRRNERNKIEYRLTIKEKIEKRYKIVSDRLADICKENDGTIVSFDGASREIIITHKLKEQEFAELRKWVKVSPQFYSRLSKAEKEEQDNLQRDWEALLKTIDDDKELHIPLSKEIKFDPEYINLEDDEKRILSLTENLFERNNFDSMVVCMPIDVSKFDGLSADKVVRRLINYGEAFFFEDKEDWKDYKVAVLPVLQTDISTVQRFIKLISIYKSNMLFSFEQPLRHCPVCNGTNIVCLDDNTWQCEDAVCRIIFGKTRCVEGCGQFFNWIKPDVNVDFEFNEKPMSRILKKEAIFDRYMITDFEVESISRKLYPICPKCGKRRM